MKTKGLGLMIKFKKKTTCSGTMKEFIIHKEGHTVGGLIRYHLIENKETRFGACVVKHPQDDFLCIKVDADDEKKLLLEAIAYAKSDVEEVHRIVKNHIIHKDVCDE